MQNKPYEIITAKKYISDVLSGKVVVCTFVKQAVQRHVNDLKRSKTKKYPYRFDEELAIKSIKFAQLLKHSKGKWARDNQYLKLEPWQQFLKWVIHGWVRKSTGDRRFRKAYIEVARKNGKTTFAATEALDLFFLDNEEGSEIYTAATKRDQARICWTEVSSMAKKQPSLKDRIDILNNSSTIRKKGDISVIKALGADSDTEDGLNPLMGIIDEYHAHKTADMVNILESGMGSRTQPLLEIITTAGTNQNGPCYQEERTLAVNTLNGSGPEDYFCIIYTLDKEDNWSDPAVWIKANPNLGVSVFTDYLESRVKMALASPRKQNDVKTKNFNVWTNARTAWITSEIWDACGGEIIAADLIGRKAYGAFDLSFSVDLSAFALAFPPIGEEKQYQLLLKFYMPADVIQEKTIEDRVPYELWRQQGWITATPGNIIDHDFIEQDIKDACDLYDVIKIGYDPWKASQVVTRLKNEGLELVVVRQGYATMSPFAKNFETLLRAKKINHGINPVLSWNMSCTTLQQDSSENIKPVKPERKTGKRIDGIVATIMALGISMEDGEEIEDDGNLRVV